MALVVTIIILIILASISLGAVFGETGLIKKAQQAKDMYDKSVQYEEEVMNQLMQEYENQMGSLNDQESSENKTDNTNSVGDSGETEIKKDPPTLWGEYAPGYVNPNSLIDGRAEVTNIPTRGYYRVGEVAEAKIRIENVDSHELEITINVLLDGSAFNDEAAEYSGKKLTFTLKPGEVKEAICEYTVTRNDLSTRGFNMVFSGSASYSGVGEAEPNGYETGTFSTGTIPAGVQV